MKTIKTVLRRLAEMPGCTSGAVQHLCKHGAEVMDASGLPTGRAAAAAEDSRVRARLECRGARASLARHLQAHHEGHRLRIDSSLEVKLFLPLRQPTHPIHREVVRERPAQCLKLLAVANRHTEAHVCDILGQAMRAFQLDASPPCSLPEGGRAMRVNQHLEVHPSRAAPQVQAEWLGHHQPVVLLELARVNRPVHADGASTGEERQVPWGGVLAQGARSHEHHGGARVVPVGQDSAYDLVILKLPVADDHVLV
mmetsp:Transcript_2908/g.8100  ORF Transcript_2908/g.8100 Transcript_2908/m.8100 type:complete len:254 (+) Transcript_2908:96-857(+)